MTSPTRLRTATDRLKVALGVMLFLLAGLSHQLAIAGAPPPPASIGDFVWADVNANGIQDAGESGIPGIKVNLLDSTGVVMAFGLTNASGLYLFTVPAPAEYGLRFEVFSGLLLTTADQGANDSRDSDAGPGGLVPNFTLASGQSNLSFDAGLCFATDPNCGRQVPGRQVPEPATLALLALGLAGLAASRRRKQ